MPDAGRGGDVRHQPVLRRGSDGQGMHVRVCWRRAEINPGAAAVRAAKQAAGETGHQLAAERGEEGVVVGVSRRHGQCTRERFIDAGQPYGRQRPRRPAVGRALHRAFRRAIAGRFDETIGCPRGAILRVERRHGHAKARRVAAYAGPGQSAVGAATGCAVAGGEQCMIAGKRG